MGVLKIKFACDDDYMVIIEISDDGRGIDREKLGMKAVEKGIISIFECHRMEAEMINDLIFHKGLSTVENVSYTSGRGVGVAELMESAKGLGGSVSVRSKSGKGTKLTVNIPHRIPRSQLLPNQAFPRIMICEDEVELQVLYEDILGTLDVDICCFSNGLDGLNAISQEKFDLVITDLQMPDMEGESLIARIRDIHKESIPIIVISSLLDAELDAVLREYDNLILLTKDRVIDILPLVKDMLFCERSRVAQ